MAKKRVHEIAKERGISSKEVIATLQKAGLDVKAAASSVDADDAAKAFNGGGDIGAAARERAEAKQQRPRPAGGQGFAAPPTRPVQRPPRPQQEGDQRQPGARQQREGGGGPQGGGQGQDGAGAAGGTPSEGAGDRPQRPTRGGPAGRGSSGRRRVIIDSQAARRPAGPPQQQQQPPRRGRGRRRRTPWVEPDLTAQPEEVKEDPITKIASGATVKEVAESLGLGAPEVIKKLMELGEMATLTQTLSDDTVEILAEAFDKKVDIQSAADEQ